MSDDKNKQYQKPNNTIKEFKEKIHNYNIEKIGEWYKKVLEEFPFLRKLEERGNITIKQIEQDKAERKREIEKRKEKIHDDFITYFPFVEKVENKINEINKFDGKKAIVESFYEAIDDIKKGFGNFMDSFKETDAKGISKNYNQLDSLAKKHNHQIEQKLHK